MKKFFSVVVLIGVMAMIIPAVIAEEGKFPMSNGLVISMDGYCDGIQFEFDLSTGYTWGQRIGCLSDPLAGTVGSVFVQGTSVTLAPGTVAGEYPGMTTVVRANGTWSHISNDGGGLYFVNEGTWSIGAPAVAAQGFLPSTQ